LINRIINTKPCEDSGPSRAYKKSTRPNDVRHNSRDSDPPRIAAHFAPENGSQSNARYSPFSCTTPYGLAPRFSFTGIGATPGLITTDILLSVLDLSKDVDPLIQSGNAEKTSGGNAIA
jgi:hypothetical protein